MPDRYDVVVIGAGIIGAACAYACARRGLSVAVLERGGLLGGATGSGEGNLLVSDKSPGPELDLALRSLRLWQQLGAELPDRYGDFELEPKGGLMVARTGSGLAALHEFAAGQGAAGVTVEPLDPAGLRDVEPELTDGLAGGVYYPQDMQLMPARAAVVLLAAARGAGASVRLRTEVTSVRRDAAGRVTGVGTANGVIGAGHVVNAAGAWAGDVAGLAEVAVPVTPRRGFVLVTEPVPPLVRHKVYVADYLENVASGDADLQSSAVVEGTPSGTILIGATRELVGFDPTPNPEAVRRLAYGAISLFPALAGIRAMRFYHGFRPFSPDHLPVIGADPRAPGLVHAHGHEGAGIGLAPITGELVAQLVLGEHPELDLRPFSPVRFMTDEEEHVDAAA
ncbi:glycine/D-amino acid oxidase-like deaminating enzyme [Micromonospora pisi]|uniref:Glycine/D-amino acid oxidase-like deaminating enzyme n=1 Tax=Micromonospora pisi TaxID=589240 RepID=A0A495JSB8_9ACTN|nr:FAD-binding oxidoreductase [Micromonospora pisi]RKR91254.1 glycine/D-amino acid oxidase-like deaminating enzyme [Micromonospora pisi]